VAFAGAAAADPVIVMPTCSTPRASPAEADEPISNNRINAERHIAALLTRAAVLIRGQRCPVLGRVTMDQTIADVTDVPGVSCGDEVVLVGRQNGAEISIGEFSQWADTIPWETLCSVTKRVPRLYRTALGV